MTLQFEQVRAIVQDKFSVKKKRPQALFCISTLDGVSAFQNLQHLFQFHPHLADDLVAAAYVILGAVTFELLSGATDGETLFIQQTAYLANHDHVTALIIAAVTASS